MSSKQTPIKRTLNAVARILCAESTRFPWIKVAKYYILINVHIFINSSLCVYTRRCNGCLLTSFPLRLSVFFSVVSTFRETRWSDNCASLRSFALTARDRQKAETCFKVRFRIFLDASLGLDWRWRPTRLHHKLDLANVDVAPGARFCIDASFFWCVLTRGMKIKCWNVSRYSLGAILSAWRTSPLSPECCANVSQLHH